MTTTGSDDKACERANAHRTKRETEKDPTWTFINTRNVYSFETRILSVAVKHIGSVRQLIDRPRKRRFPWRESREFHRNTPVKPHWRGLGTAGPIFWRDRGNVWRQGRRSPRWRGGGGSVTTTMYTGSWCVWNRLRNVLTRRRRCTLSACVTPRAVFRALYSRGAVAVWLFFSHF
jgi:hypothetical protein